MMLVVRTTKMVAIKIIIGRYTSDNDDDDEDNKDDGDDIADQNKDDNNCD